MLAAADSLVWGAEMAPIEKLGDGRSTGLGWPPLDDDTQQPTERWRRQWGGMGEETRPGGTCERGRLPVV